MKAVAAAIAASLAAVLATGCASMSKEECQYVDWHTVGFEDGAAGRPASRLGDHRRACAEHGVTVDLAAYNAGREAGMREFCQAHNGYRVGASGQVYYGSCPADLAPAFERGYDTGRELYVRRQRVAEAEDGIAARHAEIRRLEDGLARGAFVLTGETSTVEQRTQAVVDARQAAERIGRLRKEIETLEADRARYERELESYEATVAATY
jgi:uncharacterized small protein (DUF1192 family)